METPKSSLLTRISYILATLIILLVIIAVQTPKHLRQRDRSRHSACEAQLTNIGVAIEDYKIEGGRLKNLDARGDAVCDHMYAGYDSPEGCAGKVGDKADQVCVENTLDIEVIDETRFEITAQTRNKYPCPICVTEKGAVKDSFDLCQAQKPVPCLH